jgi:phage shock protein PspC (stress-responsive transcriptional regulator)
MAAPEGRFDFYAPRPMLAGVCAEIAAGTGLPVGLVRGVMAVCAVLPTGIAYAVLASLTGRVRTPRAGRTGAALGRDWMALSQRFAAIEPRLSSIEAFVSSRDFELHKGFRQMRD